jgi:hypothetical protein
MAFAFTFATTPSRIPAPAPLVRLLRRASLVAFLVKYGVELKNFHPVLAQNVMKVVTKKAQKIIIDF